MVLPMQVPGAPTEESTVGILVTGRGAPGVRLQPAQADFASFQRRIHSLLEADGTRSNQEAGRRFVPCRGLLRERRGLCPALFRPRPRSGAAATTSQQAAARFFGPAT